MLVQFYLRRSKLVQVSCIKINRVFRWILLGFLISQTRKNRMVIFPNQDSKYIKFWRGVRTLVIQINCSFFLKYIVFYLLNNSMKRLLRYIIYTNLRCNLMFYEVLFMFQHVCHTHTHFGASVVRTKLLSYFYLFNMNPL